MKTVTEALIVLERLAEAPSEVDPAEVSAALSFLDDGFAGGEGRKFVSEMGTCCEQLVQLRPEDGWRSSYEAEAWGEHLMDLCSKLSEIAPVPNPKSKRAGITSHNSWSYRR
jgi:hypothetical protein